MKKYRLIQMIFIISVIYFYTVPIEARNDDDYDEPALMKWAEIVDSAFFKSIDSLMDIAYQREVKFITVNFIELKDNWASETLSQVDPELYAECQGENSGELLSISAREDCPEWASEIIAIVEYRSRYYLFDRICPELFRLTNDTYICKSEIMLLCLIKPSMIFRKKDIIRLLPADHPFKLRYFE